MFGQTADIVVALDVLRLAGFCSGRFDNIGVNGPLREPFHLGKIDRMLIKNVDEHPTDNLTLLFRVRNPLQGIHEALLRIDTDNVYPQIFREGGHHLIPFMEAQQAVVYEHTCKLIADSPVNQRRRHR